MQQAPVDISTVLDPFMGSGTTGVACAIEGKTFTGIERERKYLTLLAAA
jgi:DNA modification methylase